MTKGLTVSQLARIGKVSADTIRYYESLGLLPAATRSGTGRYRWFDEDAAERLNAIGCAKGMGFSLREIRCLLDLGGKGGPPLKDLLYVTEAKIQELEAKIRGILANKSQLEAFAACCREPHESSDCAFVSGLCRFLNRRSMQKK